MKHLNPKLKNRLKNTALFVLTLLLVVLTALSWLGDLNLGDLPADSWLGRMYISLSYGEAGGFTLRSGEFPAARPVEIAVQTETGMKGAQYNENAVSGFLSVLEQPIGAALSAATDFELAEESELIEALGKPGAFVRYHCALPLSLIASWMGGSYHASSDPNAQSLFFGADGVLWVRTDLGNLYRCDLHAAPDPELAAEVSGQACTFAAQTMPEQTAVRPETLLLSDTLTLPTVTSTPVDIDIEHAGNSLTVMLEAFGYDTYVRNYPDQTTGMRVFVNNQSTLRVGQEGEIVFRANTAEGGLEAYLKNEIGENGPLTYQVDYARRLLESILQSFSTDASFAFDGCTESEDGKSARLMFRYFIGSVPVEGEEGILAVVEYQDNVLVSAEVHLRTFIQSGISHTILPTKQAAAAATGGPYRLAAGYFVSGTDLVPHRYYLTD